MNPAYSNDPTQIGQYFSNINVLQSYNDRIFPFSSELKGDIKQDKTDIMTMKPRTTVPEQQQSVGTKVSKSCNLPGIQINRFENPHHNVQDPTHIIRNEDFRGGIPSRLVVKDNFFEDNKQIYKK